MNDSDRRLNTEEKLLLSKLRNLRDVSVSRPSTTLRRLLDKSKYSSVVMEPKPVELNRSISELELISNHKARHTPGDRIALQMKLYNMAVSDKR